MAHSATNQRCWPSPAPGASPPSRLITAPERTGWSTWTPPVEERYAVSPPTTPLVSIDVARSE